MSIGRIKFYDIARIELEKHNFHKITSKWRRNNFIDMITHRLDAKEYGEIENESIIFFLPLKLPPLF